MIQSDRNAAARYYDSKGFHGVAQWCRDGTRFLATIKSFARYREELGTNLPNDPSVLQIDLDAGADHFESIGMIDDAKKCRSGKDFEKLPKAFRDYRLELCA